MRKITSLLLLLLCAVTVLSARENKYDRGIVMKTFIPKGQWMVGATFSYSEHVDDNFEFMSLLKDIDSEGYTFKVTPLVSYFIRDNISIGGRLAYSRSYTKLDNLSLSLGDDISLDINEWNDKSNTYSAAFFIRTYLNLGDSKRFGLFNEARLLYGFSKSTSSSDLGSGLSGVHQLKHNLNIGVAPGITCFVNDFTAVEASIAVAGLNFNWYDQKKDQVYDGKRTSSSANFKTKSALDRLGHCFLSIRKWYETKKHISYVRIAGIVLDRMCRKRFAVSDHCWTDHGDGSCRYDFLPYPRSFKYSGDKSGRYDRPEGSAC